MQGMNATTGRTITGDAHLAQSVRDILTTPIGSRVMRRDYGSRLPDLLDRPVNAERAAEVYAATAEALAKWEPRLRVERVALEEATAGLVILRLETVHHDTGTSKTLRVSL